MLHLCTKSWWYDLHLLRYRVWQTEIGNYRSFLPFYPSPPQKCKKLEFLKNEKNAEDITILHVYQKPQSQFFIVLDHFLPLYSPPLKILKIKIFKTWKKHLEMSSFYRYVSKITIIWCMLSEIWSTTDIIFCHFGPFFAILLH